MLMPARVKFRKQHRGRMKGSAHKGVTLAFGEFGLQALGNKWITARQIEAARVALARYTKKVERFGLEYFQINQFLRNPLKQEWAKVKATPHFGWR